ncbi:hypothetical protein [Actinoplanes sp. NPDC051411]|uniref:WD40 repeat domain-containing protein n=1 Tax=Actinoplanes sp. NPDC051411 TaxID=3155522 RepID=UPI003425B7C9
MDETTDPRVTFARRLQALREAVGLSIRQLEIESEQTPRRRAEKAVRLKRSTIAGMTSRERPVRPEMANFEVFVDTCLRVAAKKNISLPPVLGDRRSWDKAYRDLRDQLDRYPRRAAVRPLPERPSGPIPAEAGTIPPGTPSTAPPKTPSPAQAPAAENSDALEGETGALTRRRILLAAPAALAVAGASVLLPMWLHRAVSPRPTPASSSVGTGTGPPLDDAGYSSVGRLLSPPIAKDDPVWSVSIGMLKGEPVAVVGRADGTVQLWNPATGRARSSPLTGHDKPVYSIALRSPIAVSGSVDGTLRVWDLTANPPTSTRIGDRLGGGINGVALATVSNRTVVVSAADDRTVRVWDPAVPELSGKILGGRLDSEVTSIATGTLKGTAIAVSGSADGTVRLWDLDASRVVRDLGAHQAMVGTMAIGTTRGTTVAVSGGEDGEVRIWDLTAAEPAGTILSHINNAVKTVAIGTVNGRTIAISGNDDNTIRIWDLATDRPYGDGLAGPDKGAEAIAIGNLGGRPIVISGHWDGTIWTWSL